MVCTRLAVGRESRERKSTRVIYFLLIVIVWKTELLIDYEASVIRWGKKYAGNITPNIRKAGHQF